MMPYSSNCMETKNSTELWTPSWEKTDILNIIQDHLLCSWDSLLCRLPAKSSHLWILPSWQLPGISFWVKHFLSCPANTSVRNKILKNPNKHQQTKMILNIPISSSVCNVKSKSAQSKKSPFHLVTPKLNRHLPTNGGQTSPCSSSLALNKLS